MNNDKKTRIILSLLAFGIAFVTYLLTMAPTVSFWDCGELVGSSNILGNPHPPGNPFFILIARLFILFAPFKELATRVNFISALTSALTVTVVFLFTEKLLTIVFKDTLTRFNVFCSAFIAFLLVTFSDTFWFSAVEAEVYGTSMLIVMSISWLSLYWYENMGQAKGDRALLLICYLGFLGMGVHPFSFITIPAVAVFILLADKESRTNVPMLITGLALLSIIYAIGNFIFFALGALVFCFVGWVLTHDQKWRKKWSFSMWLCIVAIAGFSSYAYVPLRSKVNPDINEGEPDNWVAFKEYLERKQYGSESMIERAIHRRGLFSSQVLVHPHMGYGGYMLSQYFPWKVGETRGDENEPVVRNIFGKKMEFHTLWDTIGSKPGVQGILFLLFQLPIVLGGYWVYKKNKAIGLYAAILYVSTSYGLIFYMNFADGSQLEARDYQYWMESGGKPDNKPDPVHLEVRDRDYFFTPGFIYMAILFGFASALAMQRLREKQGDSSSLPKGVGIALASLAFAVPAFSNYKEHNRSGDYVPWDYAYNMLQSCRPNSILFTNGDNDTFPLWFLQTVEGIRHDVRVVNLSLVNTNWYINQMKEVEPLMKIGFSKEQIDALEPAQWPYKQKVSVPMPNSKIVVDLEPRPYIKVQDIMVMNLVQNNYPKHPVHFAVTVSDDNMMGLEKYLKMEGMVYTLTEEKLNKEIDAAATARLVDSVYKYRGLGDNSVFIDLNTEGLLTNYSATNFRLVMWAQEKITALDKTIVELKAKSNDSAKVELASKEKERQEKIAFGEKYLKLNSKILPREWRNEYYSAQFYTFIKDYPKAEAEYLKGLKSSPNPKLFGTNLAQLYLEEQKFGQAEVILNDLKKNNPNDFELWYGLSELYQKRGDIAKAREVLAEWLQKNPGHQYASMVDQQIRAMTNQLRAPKIDSTNMPKTKDSAAAHDSSAHQRG